MAVNCNSVIKTCVYSHNISNRYFICDYICKTKKMRKCDPEQCTEYKPKGKGGTKHE